MLIQSNKLFNILSKIVFAIYIVILIWIIVFKCNLMENLYSNYKLNVDRTIWNRFTNYLAPFNCYYPSNIHKYNALSLLKDDILNCVIFIPFGLFLSYFINEKKFVKVLIITFTLSGVVEVIQLFSLIGAFATKDIITNVFGAILGYFIYKLLFKTKINNNKIKVFNTISFLLIVIFLPVAIFAIINTFLLISITT